MKGLAYAQVSGGNMEDSSLWNVYQLGGASQAAYQFNYTGQTPVAGSGGCLRITAFQGTNVLFWQPLRLIAGKTYTVNGAFRTGNVANFWGELYLSTIAPVAGRDYSPNGNGDVIRGFSTWVGCGPDTDGTFLQYACSGKRIYTIPGTAGDSVTIYFAFKTGSTASPLPAPLEVLVDDLSTVMLKDWVLLSTTDGVIDTATTRVTNVSPGQTVEAFRSGLHVAPTATMDIVGITGGVSIAMQDTTLLTDTMAVKVKGLNGTTIYPVVLREISAQATVLAVTGGIVDPVKARVLYPRNGRVVQLASALQVSEHASFKILKEDSTLAGALDTINNQMRIVVTAENGDTGVYRVKKLPFPIPVQTKNNYSDTLPAIYNQVWTVGGSSQIVITGTTEPLKGSLLNLVSDDVWLYFPAVKPAVFYESYLSQLMVNGNAAVADENIRVEQYLQGTMVISQSSTYQPLEVFTGEQCTGLSLKTSLYTYYRSAELGTLNDNIRSFRLKKGYMATFARDELGTGFSRVYVADREDLVVDTLPAGLHGNVSFVRVIPWRWVSKKGWTSGRPSAEALNCSWQYDWDNVATSGWNVEYIPMRHNRWWNSYENINSKRKSTHALGFNEPERTDQANMTVDVAISQWPELLKSGLRLGSPAPSDGGLSWLYQFIDKCDSLNYRVDFVAMHWYLGGQSPQQFYNRLKAVHDRTKRPIWITEWNNGANWTCCKPTYPQQAEAIAAFLHMLDTTSFVERYSLYEWVEDTRHMFYKAPTLLTPAGEVYRDKVSPMAYNEDQAYVPSYRAPSAARMAVVEEEEDGTDVVTVTPNPATTQVVIGLGKTYSQGALVTLTDLNGKVVHTARVAGSRYVIPLDRMTPGMYVVRISNGAQLTVRKVIKQP
ncbi:glycosyl hydrolase [Chitinophaga tropicalis]|nr:glycosyl hydrolase [Chitinophaga tropicalis]